MQSDDRVSIIHSYISQMPPLPSTVTKVMEICSDSSTSPAELNRVISLDPVLTGKVLQLVNSAYYGISQSVTSMVRAIIMLGFNTVKNLALSTAVLANLGKKHNFHALDMHEFWKHSLSTGVTAKHIAKKRGIDSHLLEQYFITGLLHDIGKLPLNTKFSHEYSQAINLSQTVQQPLYISELQLLAIDHAIVGSLIAQNWELGEEIFDTITYHHACESYNGPHKDLLYTVTVADYFTLMMEIGFSGNCYPEDVIDETFIHLDISRSYLHSLKDEIEHEIEKAMIFLEISRS